ncbi:MAG: PAS domain-containing protein, partial [Chloroflexi bacterium]|nr:PAS domain-containing protein [Chloroflexota bacterium]
TERQHAERERAELLAREQTARTHAERLAAERAAILSRIADGVIAADAAGDITFVNDAARRLYGILTLGLPAEGGAATSARLTVHDLPGQGDQLPLTRAALHGETVLNAEMQIRRPDGTRIVAEGSATPVVTEDGRRLGAVLTVHDVTAQRDLERQKDEFLSNVSHDLKTPLTAIKASIGVVLANEPSDTPEPLHRMLTNIHVSTDRMVSLVEDLLELTRAQARRVQLRLLRVDLRDTARRAAAAIEPLVQERQQRLQLDLPARPVEAAADSQRLERALLNLLENACKYGRPGGRIRLGLRRGKGLATLRVTDDGPGIPRSEQTRIFDRFYRPTTETSRRIPGSGLGLPIARAMVELHGGELRLKSEPGRGSTFSITIPMGPAAVSPAEAPTGNQGE